MGSRYFESGSYKESGSFPGSFSERGSIPRSPKTKTPINQRPEIRPTISSSSAGSSASSYFGLASSPKPWSMPPPTSVMDSPQSRKVSSSGVAAPSTALKDRFRRMQRGMTMEEVQQYGVLNDEEATELFKGIDLDEKTIKKLPKKQRPYYEHLAQLKEHYEEVDQLLAGEIPKNIASSFKRPQVRATMSRGGYHTMPEDGMPDAPGPWLHGSKRRQDSSLTTSQKGLARSLRRSSSRTIKPARENGDAEAGEEDGLLSGAQKEEKRERTAKIALNVNTGVNVVLVVAKLVAVLYSSSISLLASLVDSALDLLSTFIILGTSYAIGIKSDKHLYPAGKRRFEPLGVLIFSVAMIASFVQVFIEAFQRARDTSDNAPVELSTIGLVTMIVTIAVKLVLWIWCSRIPSSGVQALAQDAENDVWLNSMSLAFPWIGHRIGWRLLDPIGGMVLSAYIIFEWIKTLLQNFAKLSGKTASRDQITRVLYLVTRFNPVLEIKEVECYHIGDELIVEVDVIFPQASSLHFAHDVSETIQCTLESLDGVIRAYVHADYSSENPQQHTSRYPASNAINLPYRDDGSDSAVGSITPTNKNIFSHRQTMFGDNPIVSPASVRTVGLMDRVVE